MVTAGMAVGQMGNLAKATSEEYRKSIVQGFTNSGQEAINGFAAGLKDASSKIGAIAAKVGEEGVRGIKDALGIASPSRVFKQIGEFSVDGLELGFLNGLKDFKSKSVAEVKKIVALLRFELAKVSDISGPGGSSMGSLRRQLVGRRAYTSPIGPLPVGSEAPYARGDRGQFGSSGYEPRMVSSPAGRAYPAAPNSFLGFSRGAGGYAQATSQAPSRTPSSFLGFSQRATQLQQSAAGGAPPSPPSPPTPPSGGGGRLRGQSTPLATPLSLDYYKNAFKYQAALQTATNFSRNFTASQIPLIGGLRNAAAEFGQAAKQVLIYGAAYKGLAFVAGLPGQILDAAKNQQQYTNALKVSTQETGTFAKEMLFIDNVQRAFGLNLETTRNGFVKLYASMAPTGFDSGSIEKLFTGISAATAALQLTPDKAERVIYAFGQMASKGQIMSEELKGQLGDVLPGALSIFAKAAGMSVKEFSKAMEDGEFTGNRFREVFAKVSDELINRFGTGAQIAGKSLQGLINTVGGDFTRTLESFAPLADSAAQATLAPLSRMLKDVGIAAQIAMGEVGRVQAQIKDAKQIVVDLKVGGAKPEQIKAAEQNVLALQMRYEQLNTALQDPAMVQRVNDIQKFTTELAKAGTFVMNMAGAIGNMLSPILNILGTNLTTVISLITSFYVGFQTARLAAMALMGALLLYRNLSVLLGFGAAANGARALAGAFGFLGIAVNGATLKTIGLRAALITLVSATVIGAVVGGIMLIVGAFASMRDRAKEAGEASADAIKEGANAAAMGQVLPVTAKLNEELAKNRAVSEGLKTLEKIYAKNKEMMKGGGRPIISAREIASLESAARYSNEIAGIISGNQLTKDGKGFEIQAFMGPQLSKARDQAGQVSAETRKSSIILKQQQQDALRFAKQLGINEPTLGTGTNEGETEEDRKKREREEERQAKLQDKLANRRDQLEVDAANRRAALDQTSFDSRLRMSEAEYDYKRALQDDYFQREMSGLDSIEARQKKFQQDLKAIEDRRIDSIRKAELDAVKAVQDLRTASIKATAVTGGASGGVATRGVVATTGGALSQDPVTRGRSTGPHLHAQAANMTENTLRYLVDKYLEIGGKTATSFGQSRGSVGHGYNAIDFLTPQNTPIKLKGGASISQYGPAGGRGGLMGQVSTPEGNFQLGHLTSLTPAQNSAANLQSSSVGLATRPGAFAMGRREDKAKGQLAVEQEDAQNKALEKLETIRRANNLALEQTITLVKQNIDSIFPVKEQKLENDLLEMRNNLELKGASKEIIDMEVQKYKAVKENAYNLQMLNEKIAKNNEELTKLKGKKITTEEEKEQIKFLTKQTAEYNIAIAGIPEQQRLFNEQLERTAALAVESPMVKLAKQLNETKKELMEISSASSIAIGSAKSIGEAFGNSFKSMISGSATVQQSFASLFQSVGDYFLDMASRIITKYIEMQAIQGLMNIFKMFTPGVSAGGFSGAAPAPSNLQPGADFSLPGVISTGMATAANGAVWQGGFTAFASGGIVQGPTLGLVGEGKYNEAIIPLPDGKSVPVQLAGGSEGTSAPINTNIVVNVKNGQSDSQVTGNQGNQLGREIEGAVRQVILKEIRPGGIIYSSR